MIDKRTIFEIHRLKDEGYSQRETAHILHMSRRTVRKYLKNPVQSIDKKIKSVSKLAPYYDMIDAFLKQEPGIRAPVVLQRLEAKGFKGKIGIVRNYLREKRDKQKYRKAFIRFESPPGEQMQIDWGHFGSLPYGKTTRKLYAMAITECYSRMSYVEFTHSQKQEVLHSVILNAFRFFGGTPRKLVFDNMLTAVTERAGNIIRFNNAFLDFLRPFKIVPYACNICAPHEKGKIEKFISYIRQNFWPLRTFADRNDIQKQVLDWLSTIANIRIHETTGEQPVNRFTKVKLNPLPKLLPDCREVCIVKVHKDFAVKFDGNNYTVPPEFIGKQLTIKADQSCVKIFDMQKEIAEHPRCLERRQRIENPEHEQQVRKIRKKLWQDKQIAAFMSLGKEACQYLELISNAGIPVKKTVLQILKLKDEYGVQSIIYALKKAISYKAWGADYIENILYQEMCPQNIHLPVQLKDEALNRIRLTEPSLADYDAYIVKRSKKYD